MQVPVVGGNISLMCHLSGEIVLKQITDQDKVKHLDVILHLCSNQAQQLLHYFY